MNQVVHYWKDGEIRWQRFANGTLKPVIDKTFPLENIVEAHRYLESNQHVGKVVVTVGTQYHR